MDLSEDVRLLCAALQRFIREEVEPQSRWIEENDTIPDDLMAMARDLGLFGLTIPEEYGGIGLDLAGRACHQAHDGERGDALAAAGFADQADGAAAADGEVDAVDRAEQAAVGVEVGAETADLEELFHQKE
jgi:alkylation response protein AidB-like acyl-CoA dehydrogenase